MIEGMTPAEIASRAAVKFGVTERQIMYDVVEIKRRWKEAGEDVWLRKNAACSLAMAIRRREDLYRQARQTGELRLALEAEKDRCQLEGLYPPAETKQRVTGATDADPLSMNLAGKVEHEHTINEGPEYLAAVIGVLAEAGALTADALSSGDDGTTEPIHSDDGNAEAAGVPSAQVP